MIASIGSLLKGMLYGAGMMYFLDPDRGRRRRAGVVDRGIRLVHEVEDLCEKGCRDLRNRSMGLVAETKRAVVAAPTDDQHLVARVRSVLGHHVCDARAVEVSAANGTVTLRGTIRPGEPERLIPAVERVAGVRGVESALTISGEPVEPCPSAYEPRPGTRMLMTAGGGLLVLNCLVRRGVGPTLLGTLGFGMMARGLAGRPSGLVELAPDHGIDVRNSIRINAPIEKVFEFFSDAEQVGRFQPHVSNVESLGDGRIRWTLAGPAGIGHVAFEERLVESVENERMTWESAPDSPIRYMGETRFCPDGDGTRVELRFHYHPPGGVVGHAAASFFGIDPKSQFALGLNRIKQYLEEGTLPRGAAGEAVKEHRG